jgi:hypothetical protein
LNNKLFIIIYLLFIVKNNRKKNNQRSKSLIEVVLFTCSYLVNCGSNKNETLLINMWSFASMILISIFSGNFLSSLVNQDLKNIESFQELVNSNLTIISGNSSYFQYINKTLSHNNLLTLLNERAIFVNDHNVSEYL